MPSYREWTLKPNIRSGCLLPEVQVLQIQTAPMDSGYSSVYKYREEDATTLMNAGSVKGFKGVVGSKEIILDTDDGERGRKGVEKLLIAAGYMFSLYSSGGKGYHFVIPMDRMIWDERLPHSQRAWAEEMGLLCDMSVFRKTAIISLPGIVQPKSGKKREYIRSQPGYPVRLKLVDIEFKYDEHKSSSAEALIIGLVQLETITRVEPSAGNRHNSIWKTAKSFHEAGLNIESVIDLLSVVNETWENPKTADELTAAVQQAFS